MPGSHLHVQTAESGVGGGQAGGLAAGRRRSLESRIQRLAPAPDIVDGLREAAVHQLHYLGPAGRHRSAAQPVGGVVELGTLLG